jgi:hypothetical protein
MEDKMLDKSTTSVVPSVVREFCLVLLAVLFASIPFFAVQAEENPVTSAAWSVSADRTPIP